MLGREVVLRKSMLDECTGSRFWEVCLAFSAVVLGKVVREGRMRYGRPCVAERVGSGDKVAGVGREVVEPLVLAHKAGLGRILRERREKGESFVEVAEVLEEKSRELGERRERVEEGRHQVESKRDLATLEKEFETGWVGNAEFKNAVLRGDESIAGDRVLRQSFEQLWQCHNGNFEDQSRDAQLGSLETLQTRSNEQNARLQRWQSYHDRLVASKPAQSPAAASPETANPRLRFQHHRSLTLNTNQPSMTLPSPTSPAPQPASATQYDDILTKMREDLRKASTSRQPASVQFRPSQHQRSQTSQGLSRGLKFPEDASPGSSPEGSGPRSHLQRSPSFPVRPGLGRRESSRSKSWKQPRVQSQTGPIPLKSEIFSPLKANIRSVVGSPGASPPVASSDVAESPKEEVFFEKLDLYSGRSAQDDALDSGVGLGVSTGNTASPFALASSISGASDPASSPAQTKNHPASTDNPIFKIPALPPPGTAPASTRRPSLAERTRISMVPKNTAQNSTATATPVQPPASTPATVEPKEVSALPTPQSSSTEDTSQQDQDLPVRRISLADRTRASISLAPQYPHPLARKHNDKREQSTVYPVNQFDSLQLSAHNPGTEGLQLDDHEVGLETAAELLDDASGNHVSGSGDGIGGNGGTSNLNGDGGDGGHDVVGSGSGPVVQKGKKKRDITPRERLFDPEAEYASVFKSRPKIATSPPLSPAKEDSGERGD